MAEFLESTDTVCWGKSTKKGFTLSRRALDDLSRKSRGRTERADFNEWPLSSRTAKEVLRAKQPSSLQTPSHFSVWLLAPRGNCKRSGGQTVKSQTEEDAYPRQQARSR